MNTKPSKIKYIFNPFRDQKITALARDFRSRAVSVHGGISMDCRKRENQISMLLDGELGSSASEELLAHIAACKTCRSLHERMVALNADMEALAQVFTIPSDLAIKVKEQISVVKSRGYDRRRTLVWRQVPIVVMTVLLAIGIGNLAGRSVSRMLLPERLDSTMEVIMPDAGESLGDLLMGVVPEENNR